MRRQAEDRFFIYDGQQRLTTLTLLLCALRDASQDNAWLEIQEVLRTPQPQMAARVKIQTPGRALARIGDALNGCTTRAHNTASLADRRMHEAARFFLEEVRTWPSTMRIDFATFLLDRTFLTVTQMRDRHMAEFAYITINTRGKPLENKDIIKGHFVQLASQSSLTAANEMSDAWGRLERMAGHRLDGILRVAFLLDFRQPPSSDFSARLMDHFNQPEHLEEVKTWVAERLPALIQNHKQLVLPKYTRTDVTKGKKDGSLRVFQLGGARVQDGGLNVWMAVKKGYDYRNEYSGEITDALVEQGILTDNEVALVGVASNELGVSGMATFQVLKGIEEGVTVLDAFKVTSPSKPDGLLPTIYATLGFEEVGQIPFDP